MSKIKVKKLIKKILYVIVAGVAIVVIGFSALLLNYSNSAIDDKNTTVLINIPVGTRLSEVVKMLNQVGLVKHPVLFYGLVIMKGATRSIRASEYEFSTSMTPSAMIDKLTFGDVRGYRITIHEDLSIREIAAHLDEFKLINKKEFFELARDKDFLQSLNIEADSIEGYLFPDTYLFTRSMNTRQIMRTMVDRFWSKVTPEMITRAGELGFNTHQFVTLASMIGKESDDDAKKTVISAAFHNRLKKRIPLQSSPTAVYDLDNFDGRILRSHLKRKSPYNTFIIRGLPPGPIANPGLAFLKAALYPAKID